MIQHRFKQLLSLFLGVIRFPFVGKQYEIKRGYRHRKKYTHFSDIGATDKGQREVYETALRLAKKNQLTTITDVGCGSAYKLIHMFNNDFDCTGIEISDTYEHLKKTYPKHQWLNGNQLDYSSLNSELIICSDVIEHVVDPDELLANIKKIKNVKYILISTPERLLARGWFDFGPPRNWTHVREWNGKEFEKYISTHFKIISHQITNFKERTQLIICQPYE